jgi:RIO-like serine/threonine protein kinase
LNKIIADVKDVLQHGEIHLLGGGNHAKSVSVRTASGYALVVKAYNEDADAAPYCNELKIYRHLSKLQGIYVPVIVGSGKAVFAGTTRDVIMMSYGGASANDCYLTTNILDRIASAFSAIHANGVYHQDVSLRNILIDEDKVSVIDFESATICPRDSIMVPGEQERVEKACAAVKLSGRNNNFKV